MPHECLLCGDSPVEQHHVASQHFDLTVPLCIPHHRMITMRQIATRIPPESWVERLIVGICHLAEMGLDHDLPPVVLARHLVAFESDPRIRLHRD